uniref:Uncharacterized protein n=1 Tax=Arundo donax TaxID=35708 RepID=A0A0A8ZI04_ARUDO
MFSPKFLMSNTMTITKYTLSYQKSKTRFLE